MPDAYENNSKARQWKGPRNLPKKTGRIFRRWRQKQARKKNRGVYSGQ